MIGLFLVTHGSLGESLVQCLCHVLHERPPQLLQLGLCAGDDPDRCLPLARRMLEWVDSGQGVLLLADVFGATPSNLASRLVEPGRVELVTGLSLPMLLKLLRHRERDLATLVQHALLGGNEGLVHVASAPVPDAADLTDSPD